MRANDVLVDALERIHGLVEPAVRGLDADQLVWRPDREANSIAWLVWHLIRVQDAQVAELAGAEELWTSGGWAERFGLPAGFDDTGYGHSTEQVGSIAPAGPEVLVEYADAVAPACVRYVEGLSREDFERVIDRSYDPPVTVAARLVSIVGDALQHAGQAGYVRGLCLRRDAPG